MHAGLLADTRKPEHPRRWNGSGSSRSTSSWSTCIRSARRSTPARSVDECVEQIDIGGPVDGARGRQEPRQRRGRGGPARATTACWPRCAPAGSRSPSARSWRRWRFGTPPSTTWPWPAGWSRRWRPRTAPRRVPRRGSPAPGGAPRSCATARTRTSRPRSTATTAPGPAWRRPSSCTEKRCPTTTSPTPTRPGGRRSTTKQICVAIIKHANPCGIAISSVSVADAHRKAHECDPLSAFGGVIAANTEVSVEMAEYRRARSSPR